MNLAKSAPATRESALVVRYAFDVNIYSGLAEDQLGEVSNLLRIHAHRSQLARLRAEIDNILEDELDLDHQVPSQGIHKAINPSGSANLVMEGEAGSPNGVARPPVYQPGPSGSLDKLADQLQALLGRVSERRGPPA